MYEGRASFGNNLGTAADHYKRFAKAGVPGYSLELAERPPEQDVHEEFLYLMTWYGDIRNRQQRGQHFEPVSLEAIRTFEHFLAKVGLEMTAFDWHMLCRLDDVWMDCVPKTPEEEKRRQSKKRKTVH